MASFSSFNIWEGTISAILENIIKPGRVISEKKVIEVKKLWGDLILYNTINYQKKFNNNKWLTYDKKTHKNLKNENNIQNS